MSRIQSNITWRIISTSHKGKDKRVIISGVTQNIEIIRDFKAAIITILQVGSVKNLETNGRLEKFNGEIEGIKKEGIFFILLTKQEQHLYLNLIKVVQKNKIKLQTNIIHEYWCKNTK